MRLYRRIRMASANRMAHEYGTFSMEQLRSCSTPEHPESFFAPTGGERVTESQMEELRSGLESIAERHSNSSSEFDYEAAVYLLQSMNLSPVEAARPEMWSCMALTLVPHVVHQRFVDRNGRVNPDRFLGAHFGGRNALGRLWWRAYLLHLPDDDEPFRLIRGLGEDQIVQLLERPRISGFKPLARTIASEWLRRASSPGNPIPGEALMRDAMKRVRRLSAFISWELLEEDDLQLVVDGLFDESERALHAHGAEGDDQDGEQEANDEATNAIPTSEFTPLPADLDAAERLDHWVAASPLTEPKRSYIKDFARGLRTGTVPTIQDYPGLRPGSSYLTGIWDGLRERGVRPEVLQRAFK